MKKKIIVITCDKDAGLFHARWIQLLLADRVTVTACTVTEFQKQAGIPADLYCITTDAVEQIPDLYELTVPGSEVVHFFVTFSQKTVEKLNSIPVGTKALFVNISEKMAQECITSLNQEIKSVAELLERERAGERLLDQAIRQQAVETVSDLIIGFARNSDRQSVLKKMGWKKEAAAYYFVILDVALNTPVDEDKPNENGLYLFSYINAAKEVSEAHCATVVCGSYDNQVFVIFAQEENERDFYKRVKETAEEITAKFQEFLKVEAWAGISDVYDDIFQTDMAYNSAYMALQLAKGHGNKRIVCAQTSDNGMANGNSIMQEIAEYIHQNYTIAGLSLNDLSEAIHLSPSHLCRLIKKYENTNFMVWLTKVRVKMAAELIRTTDMKVYEICEKVGYNNPQYFSVVFKKYMGCSPRDYK